jgi:hypothetical protein
MQEDKFSIFIPFEIEKGGEGSDKYQNMRIKGIASTTKQGVDSDGETLEPEGMDLSDLLARGTLNFHHLWTKDPLAIIGEPTKAEVKDGDLYIEGKLYPSSQTARSVYDLGEILERDSDTRRLGFSIEGKAIQRDPKNKNRILKSKLSAVAITPSPKCKGTRMEIMKGGFEDIHYDFEKADMNVNNGGEFTPYLVDVTDDKGVRRTIDKDFNIKIWKAEGIQTASTAAASSGVTQTESVNGIDPRKKKKQGYMFSKGELYSNLVQEHNMDKDSCDKFWELVNIIDQKSKV